MKSVGYTFPVEGRFVHEYGLRSHALLVYALLREYTVREGGCMDSTSRLAGMLCMQSHTINSVISQLRDRGMATVEKFLDADRHVVRIIRITKL